MQYMLRQQINIIVYDTKTVIQSYGYSLFMGTQFSAWLEIVKLLVYFTIHENVI